MASAGSVSSTNGTFVQRDVIHINTEVPHRNSMHSYIKQQKMSFSSSFFLYKIIEQEGGTGPDWDRRGEEVGKW
jgi:hypothetical protein